MAEPIKPDQLKKMTPKEREALAKKLDEDLEEYLDKLESSATSKYKDGWSEESWETEMESHPFFATTIEKGKTDNQEDLAPLMQGIRDLKFSPAENTHAELGASYKDEGNFHFKNKKYRLAVANYTEGLRLKIGDPLLNTQLYTNRAAAQFYLGNHRSSLNDCQMALRISPTHVKAIVRAAQCAGKMKRPDECITWCDKGLCLDPQNSVLGELRKSSFEIKKTMERDARKNAAKEKKQLREDSGLIEAIKSRGIMFASLENRFVKNSKLTMEYLLPHVPFTKNSAVHLVEDEGELVLAWPTLFIYPEYGEMEVIEEFQENHQFEDHLTAMFGPGIERPEWDVEKKYDPTKIRIYFEDQFRPETSDSHLLVPVSKKSSLLEVMKDKRFRVVDGVAHFILVVNKSPFHAEFLKRYEKM